LDQLRVEGGGLEVDIAKDFFFLLGLYTEFV
jgi:hypothetical protein